MSNNDDKTDSSIPIVNLPISSTISLKLEKSGIAKANGKDTISAIATLDNAGDYNPNNPAYIGFQILSGSATFENTAAQQFVTTVDPNWSATVNIVDNIAEKKTIQAYAYTDINYPDAEQEYEFISTVPKLKLETTTDNARADGISQDRVLATLSDAAGTPSTGVTLVFTLPTSSPVTFADGSKIFTQDTDDKGQVLVGEIAKLDEALFTTVTGSVKLDADISDNTDVHFKSGVITPGFTLEATKSTSLASPSDYNSVRATITLPKESPAQTYVIRINVSEADNPRGKYSIALPNTTPGDAYAYAGEVTTTGETTHVDVWVWDEDVGATEDVVLTIQAQLWRDKATVPEDRIVDSNDVKVKFLSTIKPKPADPGPIIIELVSKSASSTGGTATIRTVYQNSGQPAPNKEFRIQGGNAGPGGPTFKWTGGGYPTTPALTPGVPGLPLMDTKTGDDATVTLSWEITPGVSRVMASALSYEVSGDVQLYP